MNSQYSTYNSQFYTPRTGYVSPATKSKNMKKTLVKWVLALAVISGLLYGLSKIPQVSDRMNNMRNNQNVVTTTTTTVPTIPVAPMATMSVNDNAILIPRATTDTRPMSTPTTLASKYGLGGGPLVGSQSTRLGGSEFLPSRHYYYHENDFYPQRPPTKYSTMAPVVAPSTMAPVVVAPSTATAAAAPTSLPPPIASFSEPPSKRNNFALGAMPTPYQTVDRIYIDTRDGMIVQPR